MGSLCMKSPDPEPEVMTFANVVAKTPKRVKFIPRSHVVLTETRPSPIKFNFTPKPKSTAPGSKNLGCDINLPHPSVFHEEDPDGLTCDFQPKTSPLDFIIAKTIQLQAFYRGYRIRKLYREEIRSRIKERKITSIVEEIITLQPSQNEVVERTRRALGLFVPKGCWFSRNLVLKGSRVDDKGNTYLGHWNSKTNKKEGYGVEVYADGIVYEGFWKEGKWNGCGRFVGKDGTFSLGRFAPRKRMYVYKLEDYLKRQ